MSHGPRHQGDIDPTNDSQAFYGFAAIMRRWLQGDPYLNLLPARVGGHGSRLWATQLALAGLL